jgi:hypothetical protein
MSGRPRAGACTTHIDIAVLRRLSLAALLRNACHVQTMRLLWREVRPGPPALVSDAILLEALPGEIPCQGRRAKKAGAPLAGFPARGVISIRSRAPQWRFPAWPALRGREVAASSSKSAAGFALGKSPPDPQSQLDRSSSSREQALPGARASPHQRQTIMTGPCRMEEAPEEGRKTCAYPSRISTLAAVARRPHLFAGRRAMEL